MRDAVRPVDSRLAIHGMTTEAMHIDQAISTEIMLARLCSAFAALALITACVGLYGTVAFNVAIHLSERFSASVILSDIAMANSRKRAKKPEDVGKRPRAVNACAA